MEVPLPRRVPHREPQVPLHNFLLVPGVDVDGDDRGGGRQHQQEGEDGSLVAVEYSPGKQNFPNLNGQYREMSYLSCRCSTTESFQA